MIPRFAHAYIEANFDEHLSRTQTFLRQPSISAQKIGIRQCADLLRFWLTERGAKVEYHGEEGYPILLAEWDVGAPKTLLVYGMYDVQPVDGQTWSSPPFAAAIQERPGEGPCIIARGACNSKGPLMAFLHTIEALRATEGLPVNIKWTIEGEEEIGSPTLPAFYQANRARLAADSAFEPFWSEFGHSGQPEVTLATKGVLGMELSCEAGAWGGPREVVHSSLGLWVRSPAWRLIQALNSMLDADERPAIEGLPRFGTITPEDEHLLTLLAQRFDFERAQAELGTQRFKHDLAPFDMLKELQFGTMINLNGVFSGYAGEGSHTIVPNSAHAKLDVRLPPGVSAEQAKTAIQAHLQHHGFGDLQLKFDGGYPAARTPFTAPVVQAMIATYREHGYDPVIRPVEPSATPYYLFTDVLGLPFTWGGLGAAAGSHGPDEWCSVAGLQNMEKSLATFLTTYANLP